jgi:hypothetical protein
MRYFRTTSDELYEGIRLQLDAAWGLPNELGTITCIEPAATAPRDSQGRILLAVADEFATWPPASELLPQLIAGGMVAEITAAEYVPFVPPREE